MDNLNVHVLLVEDDDSHAELIQRAFQRQSTSYHVTRAMSIDQARSLINKQVPDLVLVDWMLPDGQGTDLLLGAEQCEYAVVLMTSHGSQELAVQSIKAGAVDYIVKNESTFNEMPYIANRAINTWQQRRELAKAQLDLKKSERRLAAIIEQVPDIIYRLDPQGIITFVSGVVAKYGYSPDELLGTRLLDIVHPEDKDLVTYRINERRTGDRRTKSLEVRLLTKQREMRTFEVLSSGVHLEPVFSIEAEGLYSTAEPSTKSFLGTQGIARDITKQKRAERALKESEHRLKTIFQAAENVAFILLDIGADQIFITEFSPGAEKLFGYKRDEVIDQPFSKLLSETESIQCNTIVQSMRLGQPGFTGELQLLGKDGKQIPGLVTTHPIADASGNLTTALSVILDLTEIQQTLKKLKTTETIFERMLNVVPDLVTVLDRNYNIFFSNWKGVGKVPKQMRCTGTKCYRTYRNLEVPCPNCHVKDVFKTGKPFFVNELLSHGRIIELTILPILDDNGKVEYAVEFVRDITDLRLAEEDRVRLFTAMEQIDEVIVLTDPDFNIRYVNPAFEKLTGIERLNAIEHNLSIISDSFDDHKLSEIRASIQSGEVWRGSFSSKYKANKASTVEISISPSYNTAGGISNLIAVMRDITAQLVLERQIRQSQKMEAIGVLAGGIAHDFNNILFAIQGFAEIVRDEIRDNEDARSSINEVIRATDRATELVKQILTFSRRSETKPVRLRFSMIIKEVYRLLRASLPSTIEIRQQIKANEAMVMGDPTQLHQIVMNLCANAKHAMEDAGGELMISLQEVTLDEELAAYHTGLSPGDYVVLSVSDTGHGIPVDIREKIFEPFFSTKDLGEGTGMGLAVVHGIISDMGGAINVYSEEGQGSTFNVYLPKLSGIETATKRSEQLQEGSGHVMVVDDEPQIALLISKRLEKIGYMVTQFTSSVEALNVFKANPQDFDLILTDLTLPQLNGMDFAKQVLSIRPELPVILCTGFSQQSVREQAMDVGISHCIVKPVDLGELAGVIRSSISK